MQLSLDDRSALLEGFEIADAAGDAHEATRALGNLAYSLFDWVEPAQAVVFADRSLVYA